MAGRSLSVSRSASSSSRETICLGLINQIYAAAEDPRLWSEFLEGLADSVGGTVTAMASEDLDAGHASVGAGVDFEGVLSRAYEEYYASRNPWLNACVGRSSGSVVTSQMLMPDSVLIKTEYYNDFSPRSSRLARRCAGLVIHKK